MCKRLLDLVGATGLLLLTAPVLAVCVCAIKLDSRGPAFYAQRRIGRYGQPFRMIKLRTMVCGADRQAAELIQHSLEGGWLKLDEDPRITRVGRFLRQTSLDELPQVFNVLRGEMSLVGPRPLPEATDRRITGWARRRCEMPPGLTGVWQVSGRDDTTFEEMLRLDYEYVATWSVRTDVQLLLLTPAAVFRRRGAG